jgi:hypothetical protein
MIINHPGIISDYLVQTFGKTSYQVSNLKIQLDASPYILKEKNYSNSFCFWSPYKFSFYTKNYILQLCFSLSGNFYFKLATDNKKNNIDTQLYTKLFKNKESFLEAAFIIDPLYKIENIFEKQLFIYFLNRFFNEEELIKLSFQCVEYYQPFIFEALSKEIE